MGRGFSKRTGLTRDTILKIAGLGIIIMAAATSPYFLHQVAKKYFGEKIQKAIRSRAKKLREMERRKLVAFKELGNGTVRIELTHKGKNLLRIYNLEDIAIKRPDRWDKQWRIIIYDIPTSQKQASNAFREKIKQLGLFPLQRSVWVYPYECLSEIEFLATIFDINIDDCICCLLVNKIPRENEIRKFFNL